MKRKSFFIVMMLLLLASYSCLSNTTTTTSTTSYSSDSSSSTTTTSFYSTTQPTTQVNLCGSITQAPPIGVPPNIAPPTTTVYTTKPLQTTTLSTTTRTTTTTMTTTDYTTTQSTAMQSSSITITPTKITATTLTTLPTISSSVTSAFDETLKEPFIQALLHFNSAFLYGVKIQTYHIHTDPSVVLYKSFEELQIASKDPWLVKEVQYFCDNRTLDQEDEYPDFHQEIYYIGNHMIKFFNGERSEEIRDFEFILSFEPDYLLFFVEVLKIYDVTDTRLILYADLETFEKTEYNPSELLIIVIDIEQGQLTRLFLEGKEFGGFDWFQMTYHYVYTPYNESIIDIDVSK